METNGGADAGGGIVSGVGAGMVEDVDAGVDAVCCWPSDRTDAIDGVATIPTHPTVKQNARTSLRVDMLPPPTPLPQHIRPIQGAVCFPDPKKNLREYFSGSGRSPCHRRYVRRSPSFSSAQREDRCQLEQKAPEQQATQVEPALAHWWWGEAAQRAVFQGQESSRRSCDDRRTPVRSSAWARFRR